MKYYGNRFGMAIAVIMIFILNAIWPMDIQLALILLTLFELGRLQDGLR